MVKDRFGREISNLRMSVTQRCDMGCFYCHREGQLASLEEMTPQEIDRILSAASSLGIKRLKITGGEPLLREDILEIVEIGSRHFDDVSMTTNGRLLSRMAAPLREAGLDRVNVSLDTLKMETYERITGRDALKEVLEGIRAAVREDLSPVKLNMVVIKGINHHEIEDMISFARATGTILQLIEMEASRERAREDFYRRYHYDLKAVEEGLKARSLKVVERALQHRTKYFLPQEIEVVRPMHNTEFCSNCRRIRLTSDGRIKPCLLSSDGTVDVLTPLRECASQEMVRELFLRAIESREPYWR